MSSTVLLVAALILGPLSALALNASPSAAPGLAVAAALFALGVPSAIILAPHVPWIARFLRLFVGLFAIGLFAVVGIVMLNAAGWPWLVWPAAVAAVIALVVILAEQPHPRAPTPRAA